MCEGDEGETYCIVPVPEALDTKLHDREDEDGDEDGQ